MVFGVWCDDLAFWCGLTPPIYKGMKGQTRPQIVQVEVEVENQRLKSK